MDIQPESTDRGFHDCRGCAGVWPIAVAARLFQKVRTSLPDFERRAREFMRSRVDPGIEVSSLSVYSVEVGSDDESRQQRFVLEMSDADAIVIHRVSFSSGEPVDYGYDD